MQVIGFFGNVLEQVGALWLFVSTPLGELNSSITLEPFKSASILTLLSVSLVSFLITMLVVHIIKLFL